MSSWKILLHSLRRKLCISALESDHKITKNCNANGRFSELSKFQLTILNFPLIPQTSSQPPSSASDMRLNIFSIFAFLPLVIFTALLVDAFDRRKGIWERSVAGERVLSSLGRRRRAVETGP